MVNVRPPIQPPEPPDVDAGDPHRRTPGRFNVLLTQDRAHAHRPWSRQLSGLLAPQGVRAFVAYSGRQALATLDEVTLHAAVVDLATPRDDRSAAAVAADPGGLWLLELLSRRTARTPVVVIDSRPVAGRDVERALNRALRLGAFSVINRPNSAEAVLAAVQRIIDRRYRGRWPTPSPGPAPGRSKNPGNETPGSET